MNEPGFKLLLNKKMTYLQVSGAVAEKIGDDQDPMKLKFSLLRYAYFLMPKRRLYLHRSTYYGDDSITTRDKDLEAMLFYCPKDDRIVIYKKVNCCTLQEPH